jgi:glycogen operon protein
MVYLNGRSIPTPDERGNKVTDQDFLILFNASEIGLPFKMPEERYGKAWKKLLDTDADAADDKEYHPGEEFLLEARALAVLIQAD